MRYLLPAVLAGALLATMPSKSEAWRYPAYYPSYYAPPVYGSSAYIGPYGYRSFYNFNAVPTPYGYAGAYNYGMYQQPYVSAPFHSIYFNPYLNTYQYGTGYMNTPTYMYYYGY